MKPSFRTAGMDVCTTVYICVIYTHVRERIYVEPGREATLWLRTLGEREVSQNKDSMSC